MKTHYVTRHVNWAVASRRYRTVCGRYATREGATNDTGSVDCQRCLTSYEYRKAVEEGVPGDRTVSPGVTTDNATVSRAAVIRLIAKYGTEWCDGGREEVFRTLGLSEEEIPHEFTEALGGLVVVYTGPEDLCLSAKGERQVLDTINAALAEMGEVELTDNYGCSGAGLFQIVPNAVKITRVGEARLTDEED
jgi:hypothetical protein